MVGNVIDASNEHVGIEPPPLVRPVEPSEPALRLAAANWVPLFPVTITVVPFLNCELAQVCTYWTTVRLTVWFAFEVAA